jgi:hypothetical protein
MRWLISTCALLASTSLAWPAGIIGAEALCPDAINTKQEAVSVPPDYQAGMYPGIYILQEITFHNGLPGDQGTMIAKETEGDTGSATIIRTWRFPPKKPGPVYFSCIFDNTTVTLVRELDAKATKCVVTYDAGIQIGGYPKIVSSYCK